MALFDPLLEHIEVYPPAFEALGAGLHLQEEAANEAHPLLDVGLGDVDLVPKFVQDLKLFSLLQYGADQLALGAHDVHPVQDHLHIVKHVPELRLDRVQDRGCKPYKPRSGIFTLLLFSKCFANSLMTPPPARTSRQTPAGSP